MKKTDCNDGTKSGKKQQKPNSKEILSGLKDFQRDTAEYVFSRMYTDSDCTRRFLIADEVGLGKTLVARGVIARAIDLLWEKGVPRIDIIYICSNSNIANQNIRKLYFLDDFVPCASRISLLPSKIKSLKERRINFIALTPGTSFEIASGTGIGEERALLYWMLKDKWHLDNGKPMKVFRGGMDLMNFKKLVKNYPMKNIDPELKTCFLTLLNNYEEETNGTSGVSLKKRLQKLSRDFDEPRLSPGRKKELEKESNQCISELRALLVRSCLKALEPDLIILDEFQRFKHLMYKDDEEDDSTISARELARQLFSYADENTKARVLLLSATPYKMYTTVDEKGAEDHYVDFLRTFEFLANDPDDPAKGALMTEKCKETIKEYREELFRSDFVIGPRLMTLKSSLESELRKVMVRTERLVASEDRNGMLKPFFDEATKLESGDLSAYCSLQKTAKLLKCNDALEYWKSSPYPLNFMYQYDLKNALDKAVSDSNKEVCDLLSNANGLLLNWKEIEAYGEIDPGNPRLRSLFSETIGKNAWKLLWMPPSLPYYELGWPFADPQLKRFTKRLVFSSWRMVPRMISSLTSYEAERNIMRLFDRSIKNTADSRKKLHSLLRLERGDRKGRITGMPILGLMYPSITLARACDPLKKSSRDIPSANEAIHIAEVEINKLMQPILKSAPKSGQEDDNWYWAAPILLDEYHHKGCAETLLYNKEFNDVWKGDDASDEDEDDGDESPSLWKEAIAGAVSLIDGKMDLKRPPKDLSKVLAKMALAGPGIAGLRAIARITGGLDISEANLCQEFKDLAPSAMKISRAFIHLFNLPTSNALLRGLYKLDSQGASAYWRIALDYCLDGGLQSVLDEYAHFLKESEGLSGFEKSSAAEKISETIAKAMGLKAANIAVDDIKCTARSGSISVLQKKMRTNFAVMLSEKESDEGRSVNRISQIRKAFNSPFWPFVLATTSIGQEGLDFHAYCHAVVHWNLPYNPVDLEQREGRVHRFKGHAIRKNLAAKYGLSEIRESCADPWECLFLAGKRDRLDGSGDLVPFWIYPEGEAKIERHVPALPLSRDMLRMHELQESLAFYRMVFGQPRQVDLVEILKGHELSKEDMDKLRIDLSPPHLH